MKLARKLFLWTITILAISFQVGSALLIQSTMQTALDLAVQNTVGEYRTQKYLFESALVRQMTQGIAVNDASLTLLAQQCGEQPLWAERFFALCGEEGTLYTTHPTVDLSVLSHNQEEAYVILPTQEGHRWLVIASEIPMDAPTVSFVFGMDVTSIFVQRDRQLMAVFAIGIVIILVSGLALFGVVTLLTKQLHALSLATRDIAKGEYDNFVAFTGDDEIATLSQDFAQMTVRIQEHIARLDAYAKSREVFVTNFSHELKTPMTAMIGYADLLRRSSQDEYVLEASTYIYTACKRLEKLSQKMLLLMELKQTSLVRTPENLYDICLAARDAVHAQHCAIVLDCDETITVQCDKNLLQTLLMNLFTNAVKASPDGGKMILFARVIPRIARTNCETECNGNDSALQDVHITVQDFGIGMAPEECAKITEAFYMVDRSRKGNNTGIGLSICQQIATLHQTALTFDSALGVGTKVSFILQGGEDR